MHAVSQKRTNRPLATVVKHPGSRARALVVDDDPSFGVLARRFLEAAGFMVSLAETGAGALSMLEQVSPEVVCLDLGLPDADGMDVLNALREKRPDVPVIILTADDSVDSVVSAMQHGAFDYLPKPVQRTKLVTTVRNAAERAQLSRRITELESAVKGPQRYGVVGDSPAMQALLRQVERVAGSDVTVAIQGESGSGKELVARAIHEASPRCEEPFVALNCAAIPETLQESELFGHEKGAFTGAHARRVGRFEQADGGTLFLDEVAELSPGLQAKLLRVLQERSFTRLGGTAEIQSNFRLLTATHKDLHAEVEAGRFRADLYYRIAVFELVLPPLRERKEDIPILARHFLSRFATSDGDAPIRLLPDALSTLLGYAWPGNVRELQNAIQHAAVVCADNAIRTEDLPPRVRQRSAQPEVVMPGAAAPDAPTGLPAVDLETLERMAIEQSISRNRGNVSAAIRELGIGRTTIYRKLRQYGMR